MMLFRPSAPFEVLGPKFCADFRLLQRLGPVDDHRIAVHAPQIDVARRHQHAGRDIGAPPGSALELVL
jgi:hypothetical protein